MRLSCYCVVLNVMFLIPSTGEGSVNKCPLLSDCARQLLVIPASSAECERHFSAFNARNNHFTAQHDVS